MEFIDIIKKLNKIDELEKENKLNPKEMEEYKNNLELSQINVDFAYKQYKDSTDKLEGVFKFMKLAYAFGTIALVSLVSVVLSVLGIFPEKLVTGIYVGSFISFIVFIVAYIVVDMWIQKNIHKWKKVRKYFIDLQNRFISDYFETLVYGYKIDLKMYKDIYKNIYDVQEYLRENDKKGFNSFNKAFEALKIDLSKYTNKIEEPHVKLVDISE